MQIFNKYFMKCICMKFNAITCIRILCILMSQLNFCICTVCIYLCMLRAPGKISS